ncbi:hypothetical protein AYI68_g6850 [Smittium mucronatum]|uniref:Uncharacterized protein n=1 Tax=Smittium mucronatum TaxID=133383 RepID=A0A1R0GQC0_9FUNG|nr:hypothetical protein AYI68_g6850 [Smittium mucronatum]
MEKDKFQAPDSKSSDGVLLSGNPSWKADHRKPSTTDIKQKVLELFAELLDIKTNEKTPNNNKISTPKKFNIQSEPCYPTSSPPTSTNVNNKEFSLIQSIKNDSLQNSSNSVTSFKDSIVNDSIKDIDYSIKKRKASLDDSRNKYSISQSVEFSKKKLSNPKISLASVTSNIQPRNISSFSDININSSTVESTGFRGVKADLRNSYLSLPSHPLIKSKSEIWPQFPNSSSNLVSKKVTPRLPRRNLKPLDFSSLNKDRNGTNSKNNASVTYPNDTFSDLTSSVDLPSISGSDSSRPNLNLSNFSCTPDFLTVPLPLSSENSAEINSSNFNPFSNLLNEAHQRSQLSKSALLKDNHQKDSMGINDFHNQNGKGVVIGGPPMESSNVNNNLEIIQAIERAVYLTTKTDAKNSSKVYSLWNTNDQSTLQSAVNNSSDFKPPSSIHHKISSPLPLLSSDKSSSSGHSCKYCNKPFKTSQKKISHEHRCTAKLEALLYSQPEFAESSDRNEKIRSPHSQNLDSLLESVPDLSDSDCEFPNHQNFPKINSEGHVYTTEKVSFEKNPRSSIGISLVKTRNIKKNPKKSASKQPNLKSKTPIVDSEDTMSLSEGSELNRFHLQNSLNRGYLMSDSIHNINSEHSFDESKNVDFPNLQIHGKNRHVSLNDGSMSFNFGAGNIPMTVGGNPLNLASEPPIPWSNDIMSFIQTDSNQPANSSFINNAPDKANDVIEPLCGNNNDFSALLNSLAGSSSRSNDILNSLFLKNSSFVEPSAQSLFNAIQNPPQNSPGISLHINNALETISNKGDTIQNQGQPLSLSNFISNSPFVGSTGISPNIHGSSSTITLPQDNEDYQFMNEDVSTQNQEKPHNSGDNCDSSMHPSKCDTNNETSTNETYDSSARGRNEDNKDLLEGSNVAQSGASNKRCCNTSLLASHISNSDSASKNHQKHYAEPIINEKLGSSSHFADSPTIRNSSITPNSNRYPPYLVPSNVEPISSQAINETNNPNNVSSQSSIPLDISIKEQLNQEPSNFYSSSNPNFDSLFSLDYLNQPLYSQFGEADRESVNPMADSLISEQMNLQSNFINWTNCDENIERELEGLFNFD